MPCRVRDVKAPNGEKSILFEKLSAEVGPNEAMKTWVTASTPVFEKEFGKSLVKDKNGEPLVMYRGDRPGVKKYKYGQGGGASKLGGGIYLTSDRKYAAQFGDVTPLFVNSESIQFYDKHTDFLKAAADFHKIETAVLIQ